MTKIECANLTINPIVGCKKISAGCRNCYAEKMAWRLAHNPKLPEHIRLAYQSVTDAERWNGAQAVVHGVLWKCGNLRGRKKIFIGSMADIFLHNPLTETVGCLSVILEIIRTAADCPNHIFLLLTKRPENIPLLLDFPSNVWIGVTVESQEYVHRIDTLAERFDGHKFVSVEPMLSEIKLPTDSGIEWVICGAETGAHAREINPAWVYDLWVQLYRNNIPLFFKKWNIQFRIDGLIHGRMERNFPKGMR